MANPDTESASLEDLHYILNHVFLPPKLPQEDDGYADHDISLCRLAYEASHEFSKFIPEDKQRKWLIVTRMLKLLHKTIQVYDKSLLAKDILDLKDGDVFALPIRAQNAALIIRMFPDKMVFEVFEVSPVPEAVMEVEGKLLCSYPGPAVELPLDIARDSSFLEQLASFLVQMDVDYLLDAEATTVKAGSKVGETRSTTHPRYISQLLIMILHGMGKEAEIKRITKRIADDVCWDNARNPWRRSSLWLVIRVAVQTTADSRDTYKAFMVFFQATLLRKFLDHRFSSELLHVARVKTSRRVHKLGASASPELLESVESVTQAIQTCLQERWSQEQRLQAESPSFTEDRSSIEKDITMSLFNSRLYLTKVMLPDSYENTAIAFHPTQFPRLRDTRKFDPDGLAKAVEADPYVALADFELLAQEQLDSWVKDNRDKVSACETLGLCMSYYIAAARRHYISNPEDESIMLLTIMELWVALDKIATYHCPLLLSYSPEIPTSFLDYLLLRRAVSINRATSIEHYLRCRHSKATVKISIYSDQLDHTTFGVNYFRTDPSLQSIKIAIEKDATCTREEKCAELRQKKQKHTLLTEESNSRRCDYTQGYTMHKWVCRKCKLQKGADNIRIDIHEWPLPTRPLEAEAIIFELHCPPAFSIWRTQTYEILRDIGMAHINVQSSFAPEALLQGYEGLAKWSTSTSGRITFGSETKSFLKSHYRDVKIQSAREDSVCVNNGLRFKLYDKVKGEGMPPTFSLNLDSYSTLHLPKDGSYQHLQYAVTHTTHPHNKTIANQGDCPMNLSIHEQLAFSNLRCGSQLQWMNIARELCTNVLTFSQEEVHTLITQAAWQIGPLLKDEDIRVWHVELGVSNFGHVLIRVAMDLLLSVEANWMEGPTAKSIIYLTSRLLTSAVDTNVQQEGYELLRKARDFTYQWMREIMQRLKTTVDDEQASELQRRVCDMAATCRATFDVDANHLHALLSSTTDVAILVECAIILHDNMPSHLGKTFPDVRKMLYRDRRLSHFLEPVLKQCIQTDRRGMDMAILSVWPGYRPGDEQWQQLAEPNARWLTSFTASVSHQKSQPIYFNILNGKLLVDGKPLGRLPQEIESHSTYRRIFGQKILHVIPADMHGVDYATRDFHHQIFFSRRGSSQDLVVRARNTSGRVLELIPYKILLPDFPAPFSTENVHWMDVHNGEVEFRPLHQIWCQSPQNWRLFFKPDGPSKMIHGALETHHLMDIYSKACEGIASRLRPLEYSKYITTVYDARSRVISVQLPRFRLSFLVKGSEIESENMQNMIIDNDQNSGTMIGLSSQLVLRHKDSKLAGFPRSRCVLIPHGDVHFDVSPDQNHVRVHIDTDTKFSSCASWYKYEIDSDLGLLVNSVNLTSHLYRIYLHALCSHPLPDPLTKQTGTNHALQELSSATSFSFQRLTKADVKLLRLIRSITPLRHYYPRQLQVMQTVEWSSHLPALSQHGIFDDQVCRIMEYAQALKIFPDTNNTDVLLDYEINGNSFLMRRATQRNSVYHGYPLRNPDKEYHSRDFPHFADHNSDGLAAQNTAQLVYTWPAGLTRHLKSSTELIDAFKSWQNMDGVRTDSSLIYSQKWLCLDLPQNWLSIYDLCRQIGRSSAKKKFELVFSFSALAYSAPGLREFVPVLLAFATIGRLSSIFPPAHSSYDLSDDFEPDRVRIQSIVSSRIHPLVGSPAAQLQQRMNESSKEFESRQFKYHKETSDERANRLASHFMNQWPSSVPQLPSGDNSEWLNTEEIRDKITEYFASCSRNVDLSSFASRVTKILMEEYMGSSLTHGHISNFHFAQQFNISNQANRPFDSDFTLPNLLVTRADHAPVCPTREFGAGAPAKNSKLDNLIFQFQRNGHSALTHLYSQRLERSQTELHRGQRLVLAHDDLPPITECYVYRDECLIRLHDLLASIRSVLKPLSASERILADGGLWPSIHSHMILQLLASTAHIDLTRTPEWAKIFTAFAESFIEFQFSQRLVEYALRSAADDFYKELEHLSFKHLETKINPDWLLIQIQGNFITRAGQSEIAREMIMPTSGQSTVLQLNMGEGKSHVIVPLVAVELADSQKLVRVIVLKSLAGQMFHLLIERISGLANRRIFYLPFSRDVKMSVEHINNIRNLFEECARVQGVLVAQPEHILSFRLMVIDRMLLSSSPLDDVAQQLQDIQSWLSVTSRDILDDSDELLHVPYQLIYTMGQQQPLDDSPDRWTTTQQVFDLLRRHVTALHEKFDDQVELQCHVDSEGSFPHVRLTGDPAAQDLVSKITEDALNGRLDNLSFVGLQTKPHLLDAVRRFVKDDSIDDETYHIVREIYGNSALWKGILLLRGLIAEGILKYVLSQKRWRVDYGLDLKRSLFAVPYRAKDVPSLRSEFGHPDVAICLTCLSYYYGGLTISQVRECFDLLLKLDNPPLEYEKWVKRGGMDVSDELRQLIGVNMKDAQTFTNDVIPAFQRNQATIDFFLSQVVFPREAKEFPSKLGTSGWDLAERKTNVITGFSGTNDNSDLLPTSIIQRDQPSQLRTNAQVLSYLLQPENDSYILCAKGAGVKPCSAGEFLEILVMEQNEIRVLLDVGAQMLEMTNQQLVQHWLSLRQDIKDIKAAVFFDDRDTLSVLSRDGVVEPLYSSSFFRMLDQCIIYLDDAHTRGTDLKLPLNFRAAVTLGPKVTKDRLVQGCMRMRKLGHGQSVVFCAPPEVDRQIRKTEKIGSSRQVTTTDVLSWVMSRTCMELEHHVPHWVQQGVDHYKRQQIDVSSSASNLDIALVKSAWLQPAAKSLEDMYGLNIEQPSLAAHVKDIPAMRERLQLLQVTTVRNAQMEEEQEREVSHEVQEERQVERPPIVPPATHRLDKEVRDFIQRGTIPTDLNNLLPLMNPLRSEYATLNLSKPWSRELLATRDFMTTTESANEKSAITDYLRPVNWIVSRVDGNGNMVLVVMSPYEVNMLLPDIRVSKYVRLHMYAPRTSQAARPFDDLTFYCIPSLPSMDIARVSPSLDIRCQLNIWAGQLYLDGYETYVRMCRLLGVSSSEDSGYASIEGDRFVPREARVGVMADVCLFEENPLPLLKILFGLRRKGMSYRQTHMGKILHGRLLSREDFEEYFGGP